MKRRTFLTNVLAPMVGLFWPFCGRPFQRPKQTRRVFRLVHSDVPNDLNQPAWLNLRWVECRMRDLRVNDRFTLLNPDGTFVEGNYLFAPESESWPGEFIATTNPWLNEHGIWTIESEMCCELRVRAPRFPGDVVMYIGPESKKWQWAWYKPRLRSGLKSGDYYFEIIDKGINGTGFPIWEFEFSGPYGGIS